MFEFWEATSLLISFLNYHTIQMDEEFLLSLVFSFKSVDLSMGW